MDLKGKVGQNEKGKVLREHSTHEKTACSYARRR